MITIDDGGSIFGDILGIDYSDISEEEIARIPGKKIDRSYNE